MSAQPPSPPTSAVLIDGKAFAAGVIERVRDSADRLREACGLTPGLAVVIVGDDPASRL